MSENDKVRTLGAILFPGFELLDLYGPLEMFSCLGPAMRIETVAEKAGPVPSRAGPQTVAMHSFADAPGFDLILLPGGLVDAHLDNEAYLEFLRTASANAELTLSVCNGAALLAKAGVLDGKRATSNKLLFEQVEACSDKVTWVHKARWVEDGSIITASGVSAGTDMALAVIARLFGSQRAQAVAIATEYQWHTESDSDPFHTYLNQPQWLANALGVPLSAL